MFYTAKVIDNKDDTKTGIIEVYVPEIMKSQKKGVKEPEITQVKNQFKLLNKDMNQSEIDSVSVEKRNTIPAYPHTLTAKDHGIQLIPEIDDEVLVYFKDNNYNVAYYMYANTYQNGLQMNYGELIEDKENADNPEEYINHKVLLLTKSGHIIAMNDTEVSNGIYIKASGSHKMELEKNDDFSGFTVETEKGHKLFIDDTNNGLCIKSKKGHSLLIDDDGNGINIKTHDDFRVTLDSTKKVIQIVTPMGIGLEFDDKNNKLSVAAMDVEVDTKNSIHMKAINEMKLEPKVSYKLDTTDVKIDAKNGIKMDAKASMDVKAGMLKISVNGNANIEANGTCDVKGSIMTIEGQQINLGKGAASAVLKAPEFLQFFNTHMHTAPPLGGPTTPPIVPVMEPAVASLFVKTK